MIVAHRPRFTTLPRYVGRPLAVLFAIDVAITTAYVFLGWNWMAMPSVPLSILGGVLGVIVGFRNASAYARWWEARTIWGGIVNNSRTFARQVLSLMDAPNHDAAIAGQLSECQRKLVLLQIAYVHALRNHLRGTPLQDDLSGLVSVDELESWRSHNNLPLAIQQRMAQIIAEAHQLGWIDTIRWAALDRTLSQLMDSQGASERIKNTPMPRLYDMLIRLAIDFYCALLPLGMVASLRLFTPVGSTQVGFMFLALDQIGRDLETPFENRPHDISLTAISRTIEINLKQMIGEKQVPEPPAPVDGVLW